MVQGFIYPASIYGMLVGSAQAANHMAYIRALQVEEASRVTSPFFVYPLFVFPAADVLLGETLTEKNYAGGLILVLSFFVPGLLEKALDRRTLILKFVAGILVVIGVCLISRSLFFARESFLY